MRRRCVSVYAVAAHSYVATHVTHRRCLRRAAAGMHYLLILQAGRRGPGRVHHVRPAQPSCSTTNIFILNWMIMDVFTRDIYLVPWPLTSIVSPLYWREGGGRGARLACAVWAELVRSCGGLTHPVWPVLHGYSKTNTITHTRTAAADSEFVKTACWHCIGVTKAWPRQCDIQLDWISKRFTQIKQFPKRCLFGLLFCHEVQLLQVPLSLINSTGNNHHTAPTLRIHEVKRSKGNLK